VDKTPFSVYDFFAYLASGAMIVVSVDYLFGNQFLLRPTLSPQLYALAVIASYVVGQVVSHLSAVVLEQWLIKGVLGGSIGVLLASEHGKSPWARLFPQYFHGLKAATSARVRLQAERRGCQLDGDDLYDHCYAVVTEASERAANRLDYLKSQYGFARNIAFAFFCSAGMIVYEDLTGPRWVSPRWVVVGVVVSVCMLYRYLKFYREYASELLKRYAELPAPSQG
jgi:hypothetical protein